MMCAGQPLRQRAALGATGGAVAQPEAVLRALRGLHHGDAALYGATKKRTRQSDGTLLSSFSGTNAPSCVTTGSHGCFGT